jgi:hypothetical protein
MQGLGGGEWGRGRGRGAVASRARQVRPGAAAPHLQLGGQEGREADVVGDAGAGVHAEGAVRRRQGALWVGASYGSARGRVEPQLMPGTCSGRPPTHLFSVSRNRASYRRLVKPSMPVGAGGGGGGVRGRGGGWRGRGCVSGSPSGGTVAGGCAEPPDAACCTERALASPPRARVRTAVHGRGPSVAKREAVKREGRACPAHGGAFAWARRAWGRRSAGSSGCARTYAPSLPPPGALSGTRNASPPGAAGSTPGSPPAAAAPPAPPPAGAPPAGAAPPGPPAAATSAAGAGPARGRAGVRLWAQRGVAWGPRSGRTAAAVPPARAPRRARARPLTQRAAAVAGAILGLRGCGERAQPDESDGDEECASGHRKSQLPPCPGPVFPFAPRAACITPHLVCGAPFVGAGLARSGAPEAARDARRGGEAGRA